MLLAVASAVKQKNGRVKTKTDYKAFRAAAGSWKDVDTDTLVKNIYEGWKPGTHPPIEL